MLLKDRGSLCGILNFAKQIFLQIPFLKGRKLRDNAKVKVVSVYIRLHFWGRCSISPTWESSTSSILQLVSQTLMVSWTWHCICTYTLYQGTSKAEYSAVRLIIAADKWLFLRAWLDCDGEDNVSLRSLFWCQLYCTSLNAPQRSSTPFQSCVSDVVTISIAISGWEEDKEAYFRRERSLCDAKYDCCASVISSIEQNWELSLLWPWSGYKSSRYFDISDGMRPMRTHYCWAYHGFI